MRHNSHIKVQWKVLAIVVIIITVGSLLGAYYGELREAQSSILKELDSSAITPQTVPIIVSGTADDDLSEVVDSPSTTAAQEPNQLYDEFGGGDFFLLNCSVSVAISVVETGVLRYEFSTIVPLDLLEKIHYEVAGVSNAVYTDSPPGADEWLQIEVWYELPESNWGNPEATWQAILDAERDVMAMVNDYLVLNYGDGCQPEPPDDTIQADLV